jgi:hypothetical protein
LALQLELGEPLEAAVAFAAAVAAAHVESEHGAFERGRVEDLNLRLPRRVGAG